ncbi:MAG TPA: hypothetical protein VLJ79_28510 [Candidatus Binatia bacterium]|nr:hypothetical protein [Candidatus Binatia bacterium]
MVCRSRCRIEFVLDQTDRHIRISAITQSAADLPQGTNQLATLADAGLGEQDSESFLESPAPNAGIMNCIRMVAYQYLREQRDELFQAPLSNGKKLFVSGGGFNRIGVCYAHRQLKLRS